MTNQEIKKYSASRWNYWRKQPKTSRRQANYRLLVSRSSIMLRFFLRCSIAHCFLCQYSESAVPSRYNAQLLLHILLDIFPLLTLVGKKGHRFITITSFLGDSILPKLRWCNKHPWSPVGAVEVEAWRVVHQPPPAGISQVPGLGYIPTRHHLP